jgi:hypothetical protein
MKLSPKRYLDGRRYEVPCVDGAELARLRLQIHRAAKRAGVKISTRSLPPSVLIVQAAK